MNTTNTNKLFKKFKFLKKKNLPNGICCGDGWFNLIQDMCSELKDANPPKDFIITNIEAKYGTLKVYTKNGILQTQVIVNTYMDKAEEICDGCGQDRELQGCDKCKVVEKVYPDLPEEKNECQCDPNAQCGNGQCSSGTP